MMKIEKPIFIVGVGRSGSTIFHRMFSEHPNVAWLSSAICNRFPGVPHLARLHQQAIDYPLVGRLVRKVISPGEAYHFWEYHCKGFTEPCRDLLAIDVTNQTKRTLTKAVSKPLTRKRNRLLIKITGWPRIGFLQAIFNDAKFIHIKRECAGIMNSMINVGWWRGWKGPQNWRWGELTPAQKAEWERFDRSFIALAGIELQILHEAIARAKCNLDQTNFIEINYEQLCTQPIDTFKTLIEFCELAWSFKFEKAIGKYQLRNTNDKWREELTVEQQKIVEYFVCKSFH